LSDLGTGTYQGFQGGLYPGGGNTRPASHDEAADAAARIMLLDPNGVPNAVNGRIVLISVGMSNTTIESQSFIPLAVADPDRNTRVTIIDGAQGGWTATRVADPNQNSVYWNTVNARLTSAGVTPLQVEAVWLKEAEASPTQPFPAHAQGLEANLEQIVRIVRARYPNTRQLYASSRIYAGYATTNLNPEPYAYESAFSVKWMIEQQLAGAPSLNFDPSRGPVVAPWLSWDAYLWADGLVPRGDGLTWLCSDLRDTDGTHPSADGAAKVAGMLHAFFRADPVASRWYMDCDPADAGSFSVPPPALDLAWAVNPSSGALELRWQSLAPVSGSGARYDVATGTLGALHASGGFASSQCAVAGAIAPGGPDPVSDPPPGAGSYYLVRGRNTCGSGTYGEPDALPGPRQALDAASPCPGS
jgi:hypothetical protein